MIRFKKTLSITSAAIIAAASLSSCVNDDFGPCPQQPAQHRVSIRYDHNLQFTDAFADEVKAVSLYIYDLDGQLVKVVTDPVARPTSPYQMDIDIPDGQYDIVAWCGLVPDSRFRVSHLQALEVMPNLRCRLDVKDLPSLLSPASQAPSFFEAATRGSIFHDEYLHPLFHAKTRADFSGQEDEAPVGIGLVKDTNTVRVMLSHADGSDIDINDFKCYITDITHELGHDNLPTAEEPVQYQAYWRGNSLNEIPGGSTPGKQTMTALADISICRVLSQTKATLCVDRADGTKVARIPLAENLAESKMREHPDMDDAEYLDRENHYTVSLQLDAQSIWSSHVIYINSWRIILQDAKL